MRAATALLGVLGPAALLGAGLFALRAGGARGASARPAPQSTIELDSLVPELDPEASRATSPLEVPLSTGAPASSVDPRSVEDGQAAAPQARARAETALLFTVVDARTAQPLSTFEARMGQAFLRPLLDEEGRIRHDFPEGRARFPGLIEGRAGEGVQLAITARGYAELRVPELFVAPGRELDLGTLRLERVPRIVVRVLDERSGEPVSGARVTLLAAGRAPEPEDRPPASAALDPWSARTDPDGRVLLTSRPGDHVTLAVRHATHAPLDAELVLPLSEEHEETVRLQAPAPK